MSCVKLTVPRLAALLVSGILIMAPQRSWGAEAEDKLGNWLIYNGTIRFSDRWSMFTEAQVRLWEVASHVNEVFARVGGQYHTSPNTLVALGYMRNRVEGYTTEADSIEDRIYEQFTGRQDVGDSALEHRLRLEQRWIQELGSTKYRNRFRYRLQLTTPLDGATITPGSNFLNFYDELFLNFANPSNGFDQNRLYGAYGWQFTKHSNLQLGVLWQAKKSGDFYRLQIFYTHNFDLR